MDGLKENVIEWITGDDTISVTLSQQKYINKVKRLAESHGDKVKILAENPDGSIFAHLPLTALKLNVISPRELGEEEKEIMRQRLAKARETSNDRDNQ